MDRTWATSAAKLGTRVVLPDQFEVLLDHCRRPTRGHPASLQGQLRDDATTAQSHYRHLHEPPDLLGVGGSPSLRRVLGRFIRDHHPSAVSNGICTGQMPYVSHCQRLSVTQDTFSHNPAPSTIAINGYNLARSRKLRNIADNGRAAFVVDDLVSVRPRRVRCLEIRGVAEALSTEGGPLIRLHPKRIISFVIDEPDTEAHSLTTTSRNVG